MQVALALGVRAVGWLGVFFKTSQRGDRATAMQMLTTCLPSGLLPIFGMMLGRRSYTKTRQLWVAAANLAQFYQVGKYYGHMYPCTGDCSEASVSLQKALIAVVSSNGTAFLIMTAFMGALTFKWLFLTQYLYFLILAVSNHNICIQSPALRRAYNWLHGKSLIPTLTGLARGLWPPDVSLGQGIDANNESIDTCVTSQMALQLIFGLWLPSLLAYIKELNSRRLFLRARLGDEEAYRKVMFPSAWEVLIYAMPALAFPWILSFLSGAHLEAPW